MSQEVAILQGVEGDQAQKDADWAIRHVFDAMTNIRGLWLRAWEEKSNSVKLAQIAVAGRNHDLYVRARAMFDDSSRMQRRAMELQSDNDRVRSTLYFELNRRGMAMTGEQRTSLTEPAGLKVPDDFFAPSGGTPIPPFPEF